MESLNILGTGCAMVTKCYNTCFTLSNGEEHFLVDTGGGNTVLSNLEKLNIPINKIHHAFISHRHNDHITGIIWVIRAVTQQILNKKYDGNLTIYCHREVMDAIRTISNPISFLNQNLQIFLMIRLYLKKISDRCKLPILDWNIEFFDIKSTKQLQFGFHTVLSNGKKADLFRR